MLFEKLIETSNPIGPTVAIAVKNDNVDLR